MSRFLFVLTCLLVGARGVFAGPGRNDVADGKPARAWLADAADHASALKDDPNTVSPLFFMWMVGRQQCLVGDQAGAAKTLAMMQRHLGRFPEPYDVCQIISVQVALGQTQQAQNEINAELKESHTEPVGVYAVNKESLIRMGHLDLAEQGLAKQADLSGKIRFRAFLALYSANANRPADADREIKIGKDLVATGPAKSGLASGLTSINDLAYVQAVRGKMADALDIIVQSHGASPPEDGLADITLIASDRNNPKDLSALGDLIVSYEKSHPPKAVAAVKLISALAQAGDLVHARALLGIMRQASAADDMSKVLLDGTEAEIEIRAGNPDLANPIIDRLEKIKSRDRFDSSSPEFHARLARAFAATGNGAQAVHFAEMAGVFGLVAQMDAIECLARTGQIDEAKKQLNKLDKNVSQSAIGHFTRGWASAKDSSGLRKWIEELEDPAQRVIADLGVVEALTHCHFFDSGLSLDWRHSVMHL